MLVVDDQVGGEGTRTAFTSVEEEVRDNGCDRCSQEQQLWVSNVLVDKRKESLVELQDAQHHWCRQRQTLGLGAVSCWQLARPFRTPITKGPNATGGLAWSRSNRLMVERYGWRLLAAIVPR